MVLFLLFLFVVIVLLGGAYYSYRIAFYAPKAKDSDQLPAVKGEQYDPYRPEMRRIFLQIKERPCEFVTVTTFDGLTLSGRYYHVKDGAPLDICFHGYRSSGLRDFAGGSELSFAMEHNLLLVDQRAHGRSQGHTITFGIKERQDLLCWVDYAVKRFGQDVQILLYGVSMGGATVLMASELDLPENIRGIVADCPFSSPMDVILHVGRDHPIPKWLMKPFVILGAKVFGGFDIMETDAYRAVKNAHVPILIIHGEADSFVPPSMSDLVLHNPYLVKRFTIPGAEHGISYLVDTPRYHQIVREFVKSVL